MLIGIHTLQQRLGNCRIEFLVGKRSENPAGLLLVVTYIIRRAALIFPAATAALVIFLVTALVRTGRLLLRLLVTL